MNRKLLALQCVVACLLPAQVFAQSAVPLEPSLLQHQWAVIEHAGKSADSPATTFLIGEDKKTVSGTTACGSEWWADITLNFPTIKAGEVQGTAYDCEYGKEVTRFLTILETADRFKTGPDGLELLKKDGSRLLLMVSGG